MTDDKIEQGLLYNINITLTATPTKEDLDKTYLAVIAYKEFQQALVVKLDRAGY